MLPSVQFASIIIGRIFPDVCVSFTVDKFQLHMDATGAEFFLMSGYSALRSAAFYGVLERDTAGVDIRRG